MAIFSILILLLFKLICQVKTTNLTYYWPMSNLSELINGKSNMFNEFNYTYVKNRFNIPNSAIYLNYEYLKIPPGIYFNSTFTITIWLNKQSYNLPSNLSTIINFQYNNNNDNIYNNIYLKINSYQTFFGIDLINYNNIIGNSQIYSLPMQSLPIELFKTNIWYHLAITIDLNSIGHIYLNGIEITNGTLLQPPFDYFYTDYNYIGDLFNTNDIYSDLKIYNNYFDSTEIMNDYLNNNIILSNYWPILNNNLTDIIANLDMFNNNYNYKFVKDRFNNLNSAIYLNNDYLIFPSLNVIQDINTQYTIIVWLNLQSNLIKTNSIICLGCDGYRAGLIVNIKLNNIIVVGSSNSQIIIDNYKFQTNVWFHFAIIKQASSVLIYIDGQLLNVN
jgi:hypothetical protein